MKIREITAAILEKAPLNYQENYDNSGFQVGNPEEEATCALLTLDVTEATIEEAISLGCNLIISHHPLLFKPMKRVVGADSIQRIVLKALSNKITIFSAHTNLDNMADGVNYKIGEHLGLNLSSLKILAPLSDRILKLYFYVPEDQSEMVVNHLYQAGAGDIGNYSECSFQTKGQGSFKPGPDTHPFIGKRDGNREVVREIKVEVIFPEERKKEILNTLFQWHPYEEVAYGLIRLENENQNIGAGMIGNLEEPMSPKSFLERVKQNFKAGCIRYTNFHKEQIQRIAYCGGSGSFLLKEAINRGADLFLTADFKYHQFFEAEDKIIIADIGHFESEQFTTEIFWEILKKKFPNFATHLTTVKTNPVNYYI